MSVGWTEAVKGQELEIARREAVRLSTADNVAVGIYRLPRGALITRAGERHLVPGTRLEVYVHGKRVDD